MVTLSSLVKFFSKKNLSANNKTVSALFWLVFACYISFLYFQPLCVHIMFLVNTICLDFVV